MTDQRQMAPAGYGSGSLILALLGGAAVGAAIAYLTAPKSGREMRAQITDTFKTGRERARQLPGAVRGAGVAARDAFVEAMEASV